MRDNQLWYTSPMIVPCLNANRRGNDNEKRPGARAHPPKLGVSGILCRARNFFAKAPSVRRLPPCRSEPFLGMFFGEGAGLIPILRLSDLRLPNRGGRLT